MVDVSEPFELYEFGGRTEAECRCHILRTEPAPWAIDLPETLQRSCLAGGLSQPHTSKCCRTTFLLRSVHPRISGYCRPVSGHAGCPYETGHKVVLPIIMMLCSYRWNDMMNRDGIAWTLLILLWRRGPSSPPGCWLWIPLKGLNQDIRERHCCSPRWRTCSSRSTFATIRGIRVGSVVIASSSPVGMAMSFKHQRAVYDAVAAEGESIFDRRVCQRRGHHRGNRCVPGSSLRAHLRPSGQEDRVRRLGCWRRRQVA